jgi:hypothetical protein
MRYGPRFRLTPPWPPGLESIKKALLGPARHRRNVVAHTKPQSPYDDTLLIALALHAYLDHRSEGFALKAPGLMLSCQMHLSLDGQETALTLDEMDQPLSALTPTVSSAVKKGSIRIDAIVDDCHVLHFSWICRSDGASNKTRWNPAFKSAVTLLKKRTRGL